MATWRASLDDPVYRDYGRYRVFKPAAWSQGPVFLQQLALLEGFDLRASGAESADFVHTVVESAKLAFADREAWYGDGGDVPLATLLSPEYAAERRKLIGGRASHELRPGSPDGREPRVAAYVLAGGGAAPGSNDMAALGEPAVNRYGEQRGDTCHVDVVDRWGNIISATPSGGWLHGSPTIPELGFCLGSRAQMFWLEPGLASSLALGHRPRTTLTPTLVLRDGVPVLYLERGGRTLQTLPGFDEPGAAEAALAALLTLAERGRVRGLRIERVDGDVVSASPVAPTLAAAGFRPGYRGYSVPRPVAFGGG
jgi:gamma-glutamyltranspeptidase/glutathione hydrolase